MAATATTGAVHTEQLVMNAGRVEELLLTALKSIVAADETASRDDLPGRNEPRAVEAARHNLALAFRDIDTGAIFRAAAEANKLGDALLDASKESDLQ